MKIITFKAIIVGVGIVAGFLGIESYAAVPRFDFLVDSASATQVTTTGTWTMVNFPHASGGNFLRHSAGTVGTARFAPDLPVYGAYEVEILFQRGTAGIGTISGSVSVDVTYAGGRSVNRFVAQKQTVGKWYSLGTFDFDAGSQGSVLVNAPNIAATVGVDAVRFTRIRPSVIVDSNNANPAAGSVAMNGRWVARNGGAPAYNKNYRIDVSPPANRAGHTFTFTPNLPAPGAYDVFMWWAASPRNAPHVPVDITHVGGTTTVFVNQTSNGSQWVYLGTFTFPPGGANQVRIRSTGAGNIIADAVRFAPAVGAEVIVDNLAASKIGTWTSSTGQAAQFFGADWLLDSSNATNSSVTFTPTLPSAGPYSVYAWFVSRTPNSASVAVEINHQTATESIPLNQRRNGGTWVWLGTYNFAAGSPNWVRFAKATPADITVDAIALLQGTDTDADGLPDEWERTFFGSDLNAQSGSDDFDSDGALNIAEFLQGRNPAGGAVNDAAGITGLEIYTPLE